MLPPLHLPIAVQNCTFSSLIHRQYGPHGPNPGAEAMKDGKVLWDSLRIKINDVAMKAGRDLEKLGSDFTLEELSL